MKYIFFKIFLLLLISSKVFCQEVKISLDMENATFRQILNEIEKKTDYRFVYKDEVINYLDFTSIKTVESSIESVLDRLFVNKKIKYQLLEDKLVVITSPYVNKKITGKVIQKIDGKPIPSVNVSIKGLSEGTVTDREGNYSIFLPDDSLTLVFSYVGYLTREIPVEDQTEIDVIMTNDILGLEEVVVMGYGSSKKRNVIGSQSTIKESEIRNFSSQPFTSSLQGLAAGVNVTASSGTPGAPVNVKIRGINSINAGTAPLWIVDGMPVFTGSLGNTGATVAQDIMSTLNPNDIESVAILKDAAATAIYGSRGSNGVIIVTTKGGTNGKKTGVINFSYSTGMSDLTRSPESIGFANTSQWWEIMDRAAGAVNRQGWNINFSMKNPNFEQPLEKEEALQYNTDWFDFLLQKGSYKDANLSYSQGMEKGSVFASFNYHKDESVNKGNDLTRLSARINVDFEPVKNIDIDTKLSLITTDNYRTKTKGGNAGTGFGFGAASLGALPWFPIYDDDNPTGYWNPKASAAPTFNRDLLLDKIKTYRALGGVYGKYTLPWIKGLSIKAEISTDVVQNNLMEWASGEIVSSGNTTVYEGAVIRTALNYNAYMQYNNTLKDIHQLNVTAGTESFRTSSYVRDMQGLDPVSYNQELGRTPPTVMSSMRGFLDRERYIRSYFGRINYSLKKKYILGLSFRRDGSSAFYKENRWGNFAAVSAGWIISDETFFERLNGTVNLLKLRGSFGQTGNQSIPNYQNQTILFHGSNLRYVSQEILPAGTGVSVGNQSITWEITDSYDAGIDFGFLNNRISGSVAYYLQQVSDMLLRVSTPPSAAIGDIFDNVGDMNNWGWEFGIKSINIHKNNFHWYTSLNITTNKNKIINLTPEMERQKGNVLFVGGPLGVHSLARYAGIDPERGVRMIWEIDRDIFNKTGAYVETGRKIPATYNYLNQHKQILKGKTKIPTYFGGLQNNFIYQGFDLSIYLSFSGGNYIYNRKMHQWVNPTNGQNILLSELLTDSWTTPGQTDARYPLLYTEGHAPATTKWDYNAIDPNTGLKGYWKYPSIEDAKNQNDTETYERQDMRPISNFLEKGDFLRIKNITFGYNLDEKISDKLQVNNLRVYIAGANLWTWTAFTGFDPETAENWEYLPSLKTYTVGISITF